MDQIFLPPNYFFIHFSAAQNTNINLIISGKVNDEARALFERNNEWNLSNPYIKNDDQKWHYLCYLQPVEAKMAPGKIKHIHAGFRPATHVELAEFISLHPESLSDNPIIAAGSVIDTEEYPRAKGFAAGVRRLNGETVWFCRDWDGEDTSNFSSKNISYVLYLMIFEYWTQPDRWGAARGTEKGWLSSLLKH